MDESLAGRYEQYEREHWWFRGRRKILRSLINSQPWPTGADILEIGVGAGLNLLTIYPDNARVFGLEMHEHNAQIAAARTGGPVFCGTAEKFPPQLAAIKFDAIALFDVLEHIDNDKAVLFDLTKRLKTGGRLFLTVPAYQWLWSKHDIINKHHRRYTLTDLTEKLSLAGLQPTRCTYFNSLLMPPTVLIRFFQASFGRWLRDNSSDSDFEFPSYGLNSLLGAVFGLEAHLLKRLNLPFGISIYCEALHMSDRS